MTKTAASEAEILQEGINLLQGSLPRTWQVQRQSDGQADGNLGDAVLTLGSQQNVVRVVVEVKRRFDPKDVEPVVREARLLNRVAADVRLVVMAPWLSDRSRQLLSQAGINYVDLTGDVRFVSDYPAVFISQRGSAKGPPWTQSAPSLRGIKAGRVVRLLADVRPPYGVLDLAKYAGVTAGYVSRLLSSLEQEDIVRRTGRGVVEDVNWRELLRRRAESYSLFTTNKVERFVSPKGAQFALEAAKDLDLPATVLTGSFAAEQIIALAAPALLVLFSVQKSEALINTAGLIPADAGANVVVATPYDPVVMERQFDFQTLPGARIPMAALSQVVLDCLTGNGRMPQEGQALMEWMAENEGRWRRPGLTDLPTPNKPGN